MTEEQKRKNGEALRLIAEKLTGVEFTFMFALLCEDPKQLEDILDIDTLRFIQGMMRPNVVGVFESIGYEVPKTS